MHSVCKTTMIMAFRQKLFNGYILFLDYVDIRVLDIPWPLLNYGVYTLHAFHKVLQGDRSLSYTQSWFRPPNNSGRSSAMPLRIRMIAMKTNWYERFDDMRCRCSGQWSFDDHDLRYQNTQSAVAYYCG